MIVKGSRKDPFTLDDVVIVGTEGPYDVFCDKLPPVRQCFLKIQKAERQLWSENGMMMKRGRSSVTMP